MTTNAHDARVNALYKMTKGALAAVLNGHEGDTVWYATRPEKWTKEELINAVLAHEYPNGAHHA